VFAKGYNIEIAKWHFMYLWVRAFWGADGQGGVAVAFLSAGQTF